MTLLSHRSYRYLAFLVAFVVAYALINIVLILTANLVLVYLGWGEPISWQLIIVGWVLASGFDWRVITLGVVSLVLAFLSVLFVFRILRISLGGR